jgi:hypothetical protein
MLREHGERLGLKDLAQKKGSRATSDQPFSRGRNLGYMQLWQAILYDSETIPFPMYMRLML